jgi:hypothetical protein
MFTVHPAVPWIALLVSAVSLIVSIYTARRAFRRGMFETLDTVLRDLIRLSLDHPELRDPEHCRVAYFSSDPAVKYKYDAYATLVWNYLEALYLAYGNRLRATVFYGPLRYLGERHKAWFFANDHFRRYNEKLITFLGVQQ